MSGFKIYKKYKENEICYKILYGIDKQILGKNIIGKDVIYKNIINEDTVRCILSYSCKDIWGDNKQDKKGNYQKEVCLYRDDWAKNQNYSVSEALDDFNSALEEFKSNKKWQEYENEVNVYFLEEANKIIKNLNDK